jgi:hypothetical protein
MYNLHSWNFGETTGPNIDTRVSTVGYSWELEKKTSQGI